MWNLLAHLEKQPQKDTATNNHFRIPVKCRFLGQTQSREGIFVEWLNKHWFAGISIFPSSWEGGGKAGRWCAGWCPASLQSTSGNNTLCPPGSSFDPVCCSTLQLTICRLRPLSSLCHASHWLPRVTHKEVGLQIPISHSLQHCKHTHDILFYLLFILIVIHKIKEVKMFDIQCCKHVI